MKPDLYFNEESDYSEENTSDTEHFRSTILQPYQFESKKRVLMRAVRKKLNLFTLQLPIDTYQNTKSRLVQMQILQK